MLHIKSTQIFELSIILQLREEFLLPHSTYTSTTTISLCVMLGPKYPKSVDKNMARYIRTLSHIQKHLKGDTHRHRPQMNESNISGYVLIYLLAINYNRNRSMGRRQLGKIVLVTT